jgi:hypothetical protein
MYLGYNIISHVVKAVPLVCTLNLITTYTQNLNHASTFNPNFYLSLNFLLLDPYWT